MFLPRILPLCNLMLLNNKSLFFTSFLLFIFTPLFFAQNYKVIESTSSHIILELNFTNFYTVNDTTINEVKYSFIKGGHNYFRNPGEPWLPVMNLNIGIPYNAEPKIRILQDDKISFSNKFIMPFPEADTVFVKPDVSKINIGIYSKNSFFPQNIVEANSSYIFRYARILPVSISPYRYNPVTRQLTFNKKILVRIDFNAKEQDYKTLINDPMTNDYLVNSVINYDNAKNWVSKSVRIGNLPLNNRGYWYNPQKNYYKIYLKDKGVYRITYEQLISSGAQLGSNTPVNKLELFNEGQTVPIDVFDNNSDQKFNEGDYFQFVGYPPTPTPYCKMNIYNVSNVYWFSYESDSTGVHYNITPGTIENYNRNYNSNLQTIHLEKDSLYERFGYADNEKRDNWYWDKATANDGHAVYAFLHSFSEFPDFASDSNLVRLKVKMHGLTNSPWCDAEHKAYISITDQPIGNLIWDGQNEALFDKKFYVSSDSIKIYPIGNKIKVEVRGDNCDRVQDDEIRINWIEFDYWRVNRVHDKYYNFVNYDSSGVNRYFLWQWQGSDVRIYIPSKNKLIYFPSTDEYVTFMDTMNSKTEYFCTANENFSNADSIISDIPSDLRSLSNGADYLIITHSNFLSAAQELSQFRKANFPDTSIKNVRIKIVDINQIYDEFSYGLLNPFAVRDFVKFAFDNWQSPAPSYVVLFGDMSYDYRHLLVSSRPNFIPSIPYFAAGYGQAASDNLIVTVSGDDIVPDIAIGRLSCETIQEANILVNKLEKYPEDQAKTWKQNIILLASGLDEDDENDKGFNDQSLFLGNTYISPFGYTPTYVFRFPTKEEHYPYFGEGPRMRDEINKGATLINYYGHGGGLQWDLVFTDDDIDLLENDGRLPFVISVTCYTAHFDNQRIFGEHFNLKQNTGSIGFFGSSGLTYWGVGTAINNYIFEDIFVNKNFIVGKVILYAKNQVPAIGSYATQLNLLTYLGDPVLKLAIPEHPDFTISSADLTIEPENPIVNDTTIVRVKYYNKGRIFPEDSVMIELFASSSDTNYQIGAVKRPSFKEQDSVSFVWVPVKGNLFQLTVKINEGEIIPEIDHSDNVTSAYFVVFNLSEPSILKPIDGFSTNESLLKFQFSNIGYYTDKELTYFIEIDTSTNFINPLINSPSLTSSEPLIQWQSRNLPAGIYFWRARIYDGTEYGNWSAIRSFTTLSTEKSGYFAHGKILKTFSRYNVNYSDSSESLRLNTDPLPAKPSVNTFVRDIVPIIPLPDSVRFTAITTDGTYLYYGDISWLEKNRHGGDGLSRIYKIGTGYNGTVAGQYYGTFSNFNDKISNSIVYHSDGNIYVPTEKAFQITRINITSEQIDTVQVPPGLLRWDDASTTDGAVYLNSDGKYMYNLTFRDQEGNNKYILRILDPANGWQLVKPDMVLSGSSFDAPTGYFVFGNYIYPSEYLYANHMRRLRINDGYFEEEWLSYVPFQSYYAWCTDWVNNRIYASVYRESDFPSKISEFVGNYIDANGTIATNAVGPVANWNEVNYDLYKPGTTGIYKVNLFGLSKSTQEWDTLAIKIPTTYSLENVSPLEYPKLRLGFSLTDSSLTSVQPMELKSVNFNYQELPNAFLKKEDMLFSPDSMLQGIPITMSFRARNYGDFKIDSLNLKFYLNGLDSLIYSTNTALDPDSVSGEINIPISTDHLIFDNEINVVGTTDQPEYFKFDNLTSNKFYVARDSVKPEFSITFDGKEILNGDIISANPDVMITLTDNGPLPLDTSFFTIVLDNDPLSFAHDDLTYEYTPYPNSKAEIHWKPKLKDGTYKLTVLAKDGSGNFFDSTSYQITFSVYNETDLTRVYNYPNPFKDDTYFTFELRGNSLPDKVRIKIYTIAGRLIRDIEIPPSELQIGFNKIYWDGRDQDSDQIANGVYIYKIKADFKDKTKSITQKLALVR